MRRVLRWWLWGGAPDAGGPIVPTRIMRYEAGLGLFQFRWVGLALAGLVIVVGAHSSGILLRVAALVLVAGVAVASTRAGTRHERFRFGTAVIVGAGVGTNQHLDRWPWPAQLWLVGIVVVLPFLIRWVERWTGP